MIGEIKNYIIENIQNLPLISIILIFVPTIILFIIFSNCILKRPKIDRLTKFSIIFSGFIMICCIIGYCYSDTSNQEVFSSVIRNYLTALTGLIAFPFIVWRSVLADKNTNYFTRPIKCC